MAYGNLMPYISTGLFACQYGLLNIELTLPLEDARKAGVMRKLLFCRKT